MFFRKLKVFLKITDALNKNGPQHHFNLTKKRQKLVFLQNQKEMFLYVGIGVIQASKNVFVCAHTEL